MYSEYRRLMEGDSLGTDGSMELDLMAVNISINSNCSATSRRDLQMIQ